MTEAFTYQAFTDYVTHLKTIWPGGEVHTTQVSKAGKLSIGVVLEERDDWHHSLRSNQHL